VITAVLADAGQVVSAGQPVFRLWRARRKRRWRSPIPEGRLAEFKAGTDRSRSISGPSRTCSLKGEVRELAAAADPATRTYAARIRIVDPLPAVATRDDGARRSWFSNGRARRSSCR
jgi:multidrug efflux system membrane fusion protein